MILPIPDTLPFTLPMTGVGKNLISKPRTQYPTL